MEPKKKPFNGDSDGNEWEDDPELDEGNPDDYPLESLEGEHEIDPEKKFFNDHATYLERHSHDDDGEDYPEEDDEDNYDDED